MPSQAFNEYNAINDAKSFFATAQHLRRVQTQRHESRRHPPEIIAADQVEAFIQSLPKKTMEDRYEDHGFFTSAVILEALAIEIALKVWLNRNGTLSEVKGRDRHDHSKLFNHLSDEEKNRIADYYASTATEPDDTLESSLELSSECFVGWRYTYEDESNVAYPDKMQRAFKAISRDM